MLNFNKKVMMLRKLVLLFFVGISMFAQEVPKEKQVYKEGAIEVKSYDYQNLALLLQPKDETVYVVNFWATWCAPCIKELPYFEQLHENYKDKNVKVILVSLDFPKKAQSNLLSFIKERN
jgi:thiol-disulfide isomerase/thioredoxin